MEPSSNDKSIPIHRIRPAFGFSPGQATQERGKQKTPRLHIKRKPGGMTALTNGPSFHECIRARAARHQIQNICPLRALPLTDANIMELRPSELQGKPRFGSVSWQEQQKERNAQRVNQVPRIDAVGTCSAWCCVWCFMSLRATKLCDGFLS
jgi:hypothetical protein